MIRKSCISILLAIFVLVAASSVSAQTIDFATAAQRIRADEAPEALTRDNTYYSSNENELYLYHDILKDLKGGLHIGVGTDPNYLFAGWTHPDAMILFDFDQNIADVHKVYGALFRFAPTKEEFTSLWTKKNKEKAYQAIDTFTDDKRLQRRLHTVWRQSRGLVERRLRSVKKAFSKRKIPTFITDDDNYNYVADLWKQNKVYSVRGDLTKNKTMQDIAKVANQLNLPVKTAYFSNAEYYFTYRTGNFAKNISALPYDDDSLILNTIARSQKDYYYIYTPSNIYNKWVNYRRMKNLFRLQKYYSKPVDGKENLYVVNVLPPEKKQKKISKNKKTSADKGKGEQNLMMSKKATGASVNQP